MYAISDKLSVVKHWKRTHEHPYASETTESDVITDDDEPPTKKRTKVNSKLNTNKLPSTLQLQKNNASMKTFKNLKTSKPLQPPAFFMKKGQHFKSPSSVQPVKQPQTSKETLPLAKSQDVKCSKYTPSASIE